MTYLQHIGTKRHSGRYPWGSGEEPNQHGDDFLSSVEKLRKQGLTEAEIAKGLGISTTQLRAKKSIARNEKRMADASFALRLKDKGYSNVAIGERMGIPESTVRNLLNPTLTERANGITSVANALKEDIANKGYIDVGIGVERSMGISRTKLNTALQVLKEEGYPLHYLKVPQLGTGNYTSYQVMSPKGTPYSEVSKNRDKIQLPSGYSEDGGMTITSRLEPPRSVSLDRVHIRYAEEGGTNKDGVVELRRGVEDISLGNARYAQVRIAVNGTHYLKGMAMYSDDLPDGVDMVFNTNKSNTGNKLDAMKPMKDGADPNNPFGSSISQRHYISSQGKRELSALNIVHEEGDWAGWSKTLSAQMLSKQSPSLAKKQLDLALLGKQQEYDEIMALTNPAVKKRLLESFSDDCDSAAVHLKAAGMRGQATHAILPISSMSENEVYAPNYENGQKVVLIRFPHGGKFEIPELTVNNKNKEAKRLLGENAPDVVGIHHKVAERLSGADFDGDTVLVIPNDRGEIKTESPLKGLKGFDPKSEYPPYEGMVPMSVKSRNGHMGNITNLITDMTIKGASNAEIARAVKHSMVVIDAEKHKLNYKQSYLDNNIAELKEKYQGKSDTGALKGAATLISRSSSKVYVNDRRLRKASEGGPIDPVTGKKVYVYTNEQYTNRKGKLVTKQITSKKMAETDNAYSLSSGTPIENIYAAYANNMKALGNQARLSYINTKPIAWNPEAKKKYAPEIDKLKADLNIALKNAPLERRAQLIGNAIADAKIKADPNLDNDEIKKIRGLALLEARSRTGAGKNRIQITPKQWEAIQAGAVSHKFLTDVLDNADLDKVKALATPRTKSPLSPVRTARAKTMMASGKYTQAEVADALGISVAMLNRAISEDA